MKRTLIGVAILAASMVLLASCTSADGRAGQEAGSTPSPSASQTALAAKALIGVWVPAKHHRQLRSLEFRESGILIQTIQDEDGTFVNQGTWSAIAPDRFECELITKGFGDRQDTIQYSVSGSRLRLKQVSGDSWLLSTLTPEVEFAKSN